MVLQATQDTYVTTLFQYWIVFACACSLAVSKPECTGVRCYNGGTYGYIDNYCSCMCPDGFSGLLCEFELYDSAWPSGPYALLMPLSGCPEPANRGSSQGYIHITTSTPIETWRSVSPNGSVAMEIITSEPGSNLAGLFGNFTIRLNFCYKHMDQLAGSESFWSSGSYSVFGTVEGCPNGLTEMNYTYNLPNVRSWSKDGFLPFIEIDLDTNVMVTKHCKHSSVGEELPYFEDFGSFVLAKDSIASCDTELDGFDAIEETLMFVDASSNSNNNDSEGNPVSFCHFWNPKVIHPCNTDQHHCGRGHCIQVSLLCDGTTHCMDGSDETEHGCESKCRNRHQFHCGGGICIPEESICNDVMDCSSGRDEHQDTCLHRCANTDFSCDENYCIPGIWVCDGWDDCWDGTDEQNCIDDEKPCSFYEVKCELGQCIPKPECNNTECAGKNRDCNINPCLDSSRYFHCDGSCIDLNLVCDGKRDCIDGTDELNVTCPLKCPDQFYCRISGCIPIDTVCEDLYGCTNTSDKDSNDTVRSTTPPMILTCTDKLGLADETIEDFQISATSWQRTNPPHMARPSLKSWCPETKDADPYIQIDFFSPAVVSGLILYNWAKIVGTVVNNEYGEASVPIGCRSFLISHGNFPDMMRLYMEKPFEIDISRSYTEPAQFTLLQPILARYIRIHPLTPIYGGLLCLRLELLGCRNTGQLSDKCGKDSNRFWVQQSVFKPANDPVMTLLHYDNVTSLDECRVACTEQADQCSAVEYDQDLCHIYEHGHVKTYETITLALSLLVCWADSGDDSIEANEITQTSCVAVSRIGTLTSKGYPFHYPADLTHIWKLTAANGGYLRLTFFDIYLHRQLNSPSADCDIITIFDSTRVHVDMAYNSKALTFSTYSDEVLVSFRSCPRMVTESDTGRGFRLIYKNEETSTTLGELVSAPISNIITFPLMGIFSVQKQQWYTEHGVYMLLTITHFNIRCNNDFKFTIDGTQYCNQRRPRRQIRGWNMVIQFEYAGQLTALSPEGFAATFSIASRENFLITLITSTETKTLHFGDEVVSAQEVCSEELKKCYMYFSSSVRSSWHEESSRCQEIGYTLTNIHSRAETYFIRAWMVEINTKRDSFIRNGMFYTYIGLMRFRVPGGQKHMWVDGTSVTFTDWKSGEPSNTHLNLCTEMGVAITAWDTFWKTCPCDVTPPSDSSYYFGTICQKRFSGDSKDEQFNYMLNNSSLLHETVEESTILFPCNGGDSRIHSLAICDGIPDCPDGADELDCNMLTKDVCTDEEFRCTDGECIHLDKVCNYVTDCKPDGSDEFCDSAVCADTEFECSNKQCIPSYARCDTVIDCLDQSDELECVSCNATTSFLCGDLTCIHKSRVCDKYTDCIDGADENNCSLTFTTCLDRWLSGYHGNITIETEGEATIVCEYDNIDENLLRLTTYTEVDNSWTVYPWGEMQLIIRTDQFKKHNGTCTQEIHISCLETSKQLAEYFDPNLIDSYRHCAPAIASITFNFNDYCAEISYYEPLISGSETIFIYSYCDQYNIVTNLKTYGDPMNLTVGAVACRSEYEITDKQIGCEDGTTAHMSTRCLYNRGRAGNIEGCKNLRHLENCETFECPAGYVKCYKSFCLASMFVCDGERQCPSGEDESECSICAGRNVPLSIVYHGTADEWTRSYIFKFARQFVTSGQLLYSVSFSLLPDVNRGIRLTRKSVHPVSETLSKDSGEVLETDVDHMVQTLSFWKYNRSSLIFIEDDTTSRRMFEEIFGNVSHTETLYRVRADISMKKLARINSIPNDIITDVHIKYWDVLGSIGVRLVQDVCQDQMPSSCSGQYRCSSSMICIPLHKVCDGNKQCPFEDDEKVCDFHCYGKCSCSRYIVNCDGANFTEEGLESISTTVRKLDISNNNVFQDGKLDLHKQFRQLIVLKASSCGIRSIADYAFTKTVHLLHLDLSFNKIITIKRNTFNGLRHLKELKLEGNIYIDSIEQFSFQALTSLMDLSVTKTQLSEILPNTFSGLNLDVLDLSYNKISTIHGFAMNNLTVKSLLFDGNNIKSFDSNIFAGVKNVTRLQTPAFKFCCYKPSALPEDNCLPHKDEFSSCEDLMRNSALQTMLWIVGIAALIGNACSILYRVVYDRPRLKIGFGMFVTNLAVSDFLMGLYMVTIAIADLSFRNRYMIMEDYWRNSGWCSFAGIMATVSSEASVLFLSLITIDRLLVVKFPFGKFRFDLSKASVSTIITWVISWLMALLPVMYTNYFEGSFYSTTGVCIALPLTRRRPPGWLYSFVIFIGLNLVMFSLIALGQLMIYLEIRKNSHKMKKVASKRRNDLTVARNLLLVLTTDFLCWFPIGVMGIMALEGYEIPGDVYAWTAVLILPINSALNPFLYTLSAIVGQKNFNPRVDENTKPIKKGISKRLLRFWNTGHMVNLRPENSQALSETLVETNHLTTRDLLTVSLSVLRALYCLHQFGLGHGNLTTDRVLISLENREKVALHIHPILMDSGEQRKDIHDFGNILKHLLKVAANA